MKTTTYTYFEQTIIDNIDLKTYDLTNDANLYDKIKAVYYIFRGEYVHKNNQHLGDEKLLSSWLQGLPSTLTVPFYYNEIIDNASNAGIEIKDEEQFCLDYWDNLSKAFFTLKENL